MNLSVENLDLPTWLLITFFFVGGLATLLEIVRFVMATVKAPELEVRLTREIFFRLLDEGECVFCNSILLARNGPVQVVDIAFTLSRKNDGATTNIRVSPLLLGEKRHGSGSIAENTFFSSSCAMFIPENMVIRPIIIAAVDEHKEQVSQALMSINTLTADLAKKYPTAVSTPFTEAAEPVGWREEIQNQKTSIGNFVFDRIELKPGSYEFEMQIMYRPQGAFFSTSKRRSSKIAFEVPKDFRESYRTELEARIETLGRNSLFRENTPVYWPEFRPKKVSELT